MSTACATRPGPGADLGRACILPVTEIGESKLPLPLAKQEEIDTADGEQRKRNHNRSLSFDAPLSRLLNSKDFETTSSQVKLVDVTGKTISPSVLCEVSPQGISLEVLGSTAGGDTRVHYNLSDIRRVAWTRTSFAFSVAQA
eukprot:CAMPEP_0118942408 /NCGR_PEP_ID=MMETSP1169-20130426/36100_1 /TAXON_ID=36882 /ORGANISM="Pyramimonas obovata, Strain CCMP722" /LENGTH=141 /DNA_ID=CAMNT_0006887419 /DNA_START=207 /DNA_END=629 /DNA_ORIENTATION=-